MIDRSREGRAAAVAGGLGDGSASPRRSACEGVETIASTATAAPEFLVPLKEMCK